MIEIEGGLFWCQCSEWLFILAGSWVLPADEGFAAHGEKNADHTPQYQCRVKEDHFFSPQTCDPMMHITTSQGLMRRLHEGLQRRHAILLANL